MEKSANKYTVEQLENMGMDKAQIDAIMATYEREAQETARQSTSGLKVVNPPTDDTEMKVTSFTDLQQYANGTVVRLPDFAAGQPFIAKIKRPSMMVLAKSGKIPNSLLVTASELFAKGGGAMDVDNSNMLGDMYEIMHVICEAALVQPTLAEIEQAGLTLTDDQMTAIFSYTQTGIKALESFR